MARLTYFIVRRPAFAAFKHWALGVRCWMLDVCFSTPVISSSSRSGIALIMTLGVLSVMLIMAIAFAVSMRTERLAAGNYADSVRARQLVQTGLARALNDLANQLGPNGLGSSAGGTNYPSWNAATSYTNIDPNPPIMLYGAGVCTNSATNFVPRALWSAATNADLTSATNHWLPIDSLVYTNDPGGASHLAESKRLGRVKYLILNCSGLLDANFVGGHPQGRGLGTNPTEIAITNLPEFDAPSDAQNFLDNRATDYRYETLEELTALNQDAFDPYPTNFTVYSHAPARYWYNNTTNDQVNLAGNATDLAGRKDLIIAAFAQAGFGLPEAGILYTNLIDYVDGDSVPSVSTIGTVERVPMISKITVTTSAGLPPYNVTVTFTLWNPFITGGVASCDFNASVDIVTVGTMPAFSQSGITLTNGQTRDIQSTLGGVPAGPCQLQINSAGTTNASGQLDQLKPGVLGRSFMVPFADPQHWECKDPRFNYDPASADWDDYDGSDPSPPYRVTRDYWTANPSVDQDAAMYVANRPLQSVGELGYLPYGLWRTVKLYGPNLHRVLDAFAIGTNTDTYVTSDTVWRGRVNPNTRQVDVLSAVFTNMPIDEYPGQALFARLTNAPDIANVVTKIQTAFYTNASLIAANFTSLDFPAAADNELKKEAIFRNTAGLFSVRQNLFTIIIEAQVASGGNIPQNPIRQRAVALVWRDPYTGEMFVRSIKWLKD